jgi:hypothetical protein
VASFPTSITIGRNGAPSTSSVRKYKINGGAWLTYSAAFTVQSGDRVQAQNVSTSPSTYADSSIAIEEYYRLVSGFTGSGTGSWNSVTGGPTLSSTSTNGNPTSSLSHGSTTLDLGNGELLDAGVANSLTFTKNNFTSVAPNVYFTLGQVVMINGTTFLNSEATGATLSLNLSFSNPAVSTTANVQLKFTNTENSLDRLASADIVELVNPTAVTTVTIDGVAYTLKVEWVSLNPATGVVQGNKFLIYEGASANASLRAILVSNH